MQLVGWLVTQYLTVASLNVPYAVGFNTTSAAVIDAVLQEDLLTEKL
jgi:hypothetical protein